MTILCAGACHVWLGSSSLCTCEAHKALPVPLGDRVAMLFPGYNPYAPPKATPPTAAGPIGPTHLPDVDVARLRAAERAGAGWLSADGLRCYRDDRGNTEVSFWDAEAETFPSWWACERVAEDAVRL